MFSTAKRLSTATTARTLVTAQAILRSLTNILPIRSTQAIFHQDPLKQCQQDPLKQDSRNRNKQSLKYQTLGSDTNLWPTLK